MKRSHLVLASATGLAILVACLVWYARIKHRQPVPQTATGNTSQPAQISEGASDLSPTRMYAHNLMLRKGPDFRIYVRWLNGEMRRTKGNINPSFDDPESFVLEVQRGIIHANIGDISHYLNTGAVSGSPLTNISITGNGSNISIHGTIHKLHIPLPIGLEGTISSSPDGRIHLHVDRLSVLKLPVKGLLGDFHLTIADLMKKTSVGGVEVSQNDIYFDTQKLLPPPHIHGLLTRVSFKNPDIEVMYGDAQNDVARTEQWHNFLALKGGSLDFGKLTMHNVDLIMIDTSKDAWFDLDLVNYQAQLVNGYTRMTPQAGLEIFMPDLDELPPQHAAKSISKEWLKNRNLPPPPDVP
ncbi:MAG TPA: hypothetical protein VFE27_21510, partial [Acidobacteriaceae bacterium]|nr:hypothetical protein [Acidobacteriaceae bacterium]